MKNLLLVLIVIFASSCKKNTIDLMPEEFKALSGKWKLVAYQSSDKEPWIVNTEKDLYNFEVRFDGVVLGNNGLPNCCDFINLWKLNGKELLIKPLIKVQENPLCRLISCPYIVPCIPNYILKEDSLFSEGCNNSKYKYVRVK